MRIRTLLLLWALAAIAVPLPAPLAPRNGAEAYAIQDLFVSQLSRRKGAIVGYKVTLSTQAMRDFVGNIREKGLTSALSERDAPFGDYRTGH